MLKKSTIKHMIFICFSSLLILTSCKQETKKEEAQAEETANPIHENLKTALTLYASFDNGVDADFALGDKKLYTTASRQHIQDSTQAGLHKDGVSLAEGQGLFGTALQYTDKTKGSIFYPSPNNIAYSQENWSGAISFWLNLDPATDLKPGYCDPIQITDVRYNDAAIWVDFTKDNPRDFRLGVIGDQQVWNPESLQDDDSLFLPQLAPVKNPPFAKGTWTHILINFSGLNTDNGTASLYMNGELKGTRANITDPFTWELEKSNIFLGLSYIGLFDELSIYNRNLTDEEISTIYKLENGVQTILK